MSKYRVPIKIEFEGVVFIDAEDEEEAEKIALMQIQANAPELYSHGHPAIDMWVVSPYGHIERRDNESIEEVEEI